MRPRRSAFLVAVLAATVALVAAATGSAATPKLTGEVGPGFTIEVKSSAGKDVKKLKAGTYLLKVEDKSTIHDFHLFGPGVKKTTSFAFVGEQTWRVTLKPGTYTYQCDAHVSSGMIGKFKVTT
jgi:plastocyanin